MLILNKKQRRDLLSFAESPLFNNDKILVAIIRETRTQINAGRLPEQRQLYSRIFPSSAYNSLRLRHVLNRTVMLIEEFIAQRISPKHPVGQKVNLLVHLYDSGDTHLLKTEMAKVERALKHWKVKNEETLFHQYRLQMLRYANHSQEGQDCDLSLMHSALEAFYILGCLRILVFQLQRRNIFGLESSFEFMLQKAEAYYRSPGYNENKTIEGYLAAIYLLKTEDEQWLERLKKLLAEHRECLHPDDLRVFQKIAENYSIREINRGRSAHYKTLFELMGERLKNEEFITAQDFKNFVTLLLRLKAAGNCKTFIQHNGHRIIPEAIRSDTIHYSMARFHFFNGAVDSALMLLARLEYVNEFFKLDSKKLLLQCYYELQEWDLLDSSMNAFRVFIHRKKDVSEFYKRANQNFINFLYKLTAAKKGKRISKLGNEIVSTIEVAEREWLLQKVEALKSKMGLKKKT